MHAVLSESSFLLVQCFIIFGIGLTVCTEKTLPVVGEGFFFFWLWLCRIFAVACRTYSCGMWDIVSWPGIKPSPPALGAWSLRHWSPGESQGTLEFLVIYCLGTPEAVLVVMRQGPSCSPAPSFSFKPMRFNLLGKSSNWKKVHKLLGHRWLKGISHWFACRNLGKGRL